MRIRFRRWLLVLVALLLLAIGGFLGWAVLMPAPMPEALAALESNASVVVAQQPWLVFEPLGRPVTTGFILYPGARVDPRAYAPAARAIAAQGYLVVVVPMRLNLAVFSAGRAAAVIEAFPEIQHWAIGGHSLGGAMAAQFADQQPELIDGLVLWASYPPSNATLNTRPLAAVSIYGTRDGLASVAEIEAARSRLPPGARWVAIDGGNHAQFGWYGAQSGDNVATISREAQQVALVSATVDLLDALGDPDG